MQRKPWYLRWQFFTPWNSIYWGIQYDNWFFGRISKRKVEEVNAGRTRIAMRREKRKRVAKDIAQYLVSNQDEFYIFIGNNHYVISELELKKQIEKALEKM